MSDLSGVTADSLASGLLKGLIGPGAPFESVDPEALDELITQAEKDVEHELSTRLAVTTFQGFMGTGTAPDAPEGTEIEGPYDWPPVNPGDRFPRFRTRIRPVVEVTGFEINLPGGIQTHTVIPLSWLRLEHLQGELMVSPSLATAPMSGLMGPLMIGLANRQIPKSVLMSYRAGLGPGGLAKYPKIKRLISLRAAVLILPELSIMENPLSLTSQAADGLSESRSSGFVFKDLEERLQNEGDHCRDAILDLWDGVPLLVL